MTVRIMTCLLGLLALGAAQRALAETRVYSVHVGINDPPAATALHPLRYADDDAARFYSFVKPFARKSKLLSLLDGESQKRFPLLARLSGAPSYQNLVDTLSQLAVRMKADRAAGHSVVFYFSYSGHGYTVGSETQLMLLEKPIDRSFLETFIMTLPADSIHLFIDACHAEGLVIPRGVIQKEVSAVTRPLSDEERSSLLQETLLSKHPHVGALLATTAENQAQEWSRIQAGVFTHELLSALAGAADINGDSQIAYSEVAAFIAAANRAVRDPRASPKVVSIPPRIDRNLPILSQKWIHTAAVLEGELSSSFHFFIETGDGIRILDAHPEPGMFMRLLVPADEQLWLRTEKMEASFESKAGEAVPLGTLRFQRADSVAMRGSVSQSLEQGLFSSAFGLSYYRGWVDNQGEVSVPVASQALSASASRKHSYAPAISCLVGGSLALVASATLGSLAVIARNDLDSSDLELPSHQARDRTIRYQNMALGTGAVAIALGAITYFLWPTDGNWVLGPLVTADRGSGMSFSLSW